MIDFVCFWLHLGMEISEGETTYDDILVWCNWFGHDELDWTLRDFQASSHH